MRAIPDDMVIEKEPEYVCKNKPKSKKDGYDFANRAKNHTKVELTWEKPIENENLKALFNDELEDKVDLKQIIAPASENEDEDSVDEELLKEERKAKLLGNKNRTSVYSDFDKSKKNKSIEIFFENGLENESEEEVDHTFGKIVFSKNRRGFEDEDEQEEQEQEEKVDDYFVQDLNEEEEENIEGSKKLTKKESKREKFKRKLKENKKKKRQNEQKKRKDVNLKRKGSSKDEDTANLKLMTTDETEKDFEVNLGDDRFGRLFKDHTMTVDPTSNKFDKEKSAPIFKEKRKRKKIKTN